MGRTLAAGIVVALLALAAPAAIASESFDDPAGEASGYSTSGPSVDVVGSTAKAVKGGRLAVTVTLAGPAPDPADSTPLVLVETDEHIHQWCDFVVGKTDHGRGVYACESMDHTGGVQVTSDGNTVRYLFSRKAIGAPDHIAWAVVTRGEDSGTTVEYDRAPSEPDTFAGYR